jgi:phosphohistidine phosphatase SixA
MRLVKFVKRYKPHEIFATAYKRTQQTAEPIASARKKQIQIYDAAKPNDLAAKIMASKTDHYLIVGHSNTIPPLANLLAKKEIFRNLVDAEHGVIWVIRIRKGVLRKVEIFSY